MLHDLVIHDPADAGTLYLAFDYLASHRHRVVGADPECLWGEVALAAGAVEVPPDRLQSLVECTLLANGIRLDALTFSARQKYSLLAQAFPDHWLRFMNY